MAGSLGRLCVFRGEETAALHNVNHELPATSNYNVIIVIITEKHAIMSTNENASMHKYTHILPSSTIK